MTYFADLSRCDYFGSFAREAHFVAVGWLDAVHPFPTGPIPAKVKGRLLHFLQDPWHALDLFWGSHLCEICRPDGLQLGPNPTREEIASEIGREVAQFPSVPGIGHSNLAIPVPGRMEIFVAPSLIIHYIESHQYCPPLEFQEALLKCPEINSDSYLGHLRSRGLCFEPGP